MNHFIPSAMFSRLQFTVLGNYFLTFIIQALIMQQKGCDRPCWCSSPTRPSVLYSLSLKNNLQLNFYTFYYLLLITHLSFSTFFINTNSTARRQENYEQNKFCSTSTGAVLLVKSSNKGQIKSKLLHIIRLIISGHQK